MSLQESLLLNTVVPSSLCGPHHLAFLKCDLALCRIFLKCDLVLSRMWAPARSASRADSQTPMVSPSDSPQGLCHHPAHDICPRKWAVLCAFWTWLGLSNVWCWFDLLLAVLRRSDRMCFSLVSVLPMRRNRQHPLMPLWSCCKWFLGSQNFLWDRRLGSLFWTHSPPCCRLGFFWSPGGAFQF